MKIFHKNETERETWREICRLSQKRDRMRAKKQVREGHGEVLKQRKWRRPERDGQGE